MTTVVALDLTLDRPQQARLDFVEGLKCFVAERQVPALRRRYEQWRAAAHVPEKRLRERPVMAARFERDPAYQASRGLQRLSQEAMWREARAGLGARRQQFERLLEEPNTAAGGSLRLDPTLELPGYYTANEFHIQPGSFHGDSLAGAVYEVGVATYTMHRYGKAGDEMGRAIVGVLAKVAGGRKFRRMLYMGCGPGYKAYPVLDAFPDAQMYGIDLAAPMLRFAHRRAMEHGKRIHFRQMNAEHMRFDEGRFDLVFCMLLLHEMPASAIRNVLRSAYEVLAPGGMLINLELPEYASLDPLSAYLMDWDTEHNGEPYWRAYHEFDLVGAYRRAGFKQIEVIEADSDWGGGKGSYMGSFRYHVTWGIRP